MVQYLYNFTIPNTNTDYKHITIIYITVLSLLFLYMLFAKWMRIINSLMCWTCTVNSSTGTRLVLLFLPGEWESSTVWCAESTLWVWWDASRANGRFWDCPREGLISYLGVLFADLQLSCELSTLQSCMAVAGVFYWFITWIKGSTADYCYIQARESPAGVCFSGGCVTITVSNIASDLRKVNWPFVLAV